MPNPNQPNQQTPNQGSNNKPLTVITAGGAVLIAATVGLTDFLGLWEGKAEYIVYPDKLAGGLPTVCKGITKYVTDKPIIVGDRWTPAECHAEEQKAIYKVQVQLAKCFYRADVPQSVFDMASSHAWNNGAPATCNSQAVKAFNEGNWNLGCRRLGVSDSGKPVWSFIKQPDGSMKFIQGLANRRAAETKGCLLWYLDGSNSLTATTKAPERSSEIIPQEPTLTASAAVVEPLMVPAEVLVPPPEVKEIEPVNSQPVPPKPWWKKLFFWSK